MLSSELIKNIASFLPNKEKYTMASCNSYYYNTIRYMIIYSYNEYIKIILRLMTTNYL
jgi:hypothetical protein